MTVDREMRQILAELELISYGRTQAFNASGGKSENPDPRPSGEARPLHEYWAGEWDRDPSEWTLDRARSDLQSWKVRQIRAVDCWNEHDAILKDGEGFEASVVARQFARTPTYIRRLRLKAENPTRESEFGLPIDGNPVKDNSRERVQNLAVRGCTLRQIAMQTGLHKTQVQRILKAAA